MRIDFVHGESLAEQMLRQGGAKQPGRKHQKRGGVKFNQKQKNGASQRQEKQAATARKLKNKIAAYFRGEVDERPDIG